MAEHVRRVRRKRRVRSSTRRWRITPARAAIFLGSIIVGFCIGFVGLTYGPLGTVLSELFPTPVRYTGSSLAFNFAGIVGASLAPYIATWLAKRYGLSYVGYYLSFSAFLTLLGLLMIPETRDEDLATIRDEAA